jgi:hypothetical protein
LSRSDVLRSITNSSDELNMVCIRIGTEIVWTHVLHSQCTVELLGPVGIPVVKTQYHTCILCNMMLCPMRTVTEGHEKRTCTDLTVVLW